MCDNDNHMKEAFTNCVYTELLYNAERAEYL